MSKTYNNSLCEKAKKAISEVFNDKSVDVESAIIDLNDLRDHIDILIDALECDRKGTK